MANKIYCTLITVLATILSVNANNSKQCNLVGYSVSSASDKACSKLLEKKELICSEGNEPWNITGCGCGCKPDCVLSGNTFIGDWDTCSKIPSYDCDAGFEPWSDDKCGCGCAQITNAAASVSEKHIKDEDNVYYFGFINFALDQYAIYEFVIMIFILMAFVLNVTFIGYCCVVRFANLDYSFVRHMNRTQEKSIYIKTWADFSISNSDDDTSLERVFDS